MFRPGKGVPRPGAHQVGRGASMIVQVGSREGAKLVRGVVDPHRREIRCGKGKLL